MIGAILAVIGAVVGLVGGVLNSGAQKYAQRNAEYEAAIDFQRKKELAIYNGVSSQSMSRAIVVVCGLVGLVLLIYFLSKKQK